MPKGTSGSAVFDAQTGLLAGYIVLGCPGKCTCYMVPMCDVLAELNMLSSSIVRCQVQLNVSAIVEAQPEKSAMSPVTMFSFHGLYRSAPLSSTAPREEAIRENNRPVLDHPLGHVPGVSPNPTDRVDENLKTEKSPRKPPRSRPPQAYVTRITRTTLEWAGEPADEWKEPFGRTIKLSGVLENKPFIDILRESMIEVSEMAQAFCYPSIITARSERAGSNVEQFSEGASFVLDQLTPRDPMSVHFQEPRAWVSDRNQAPEGPSCPQRADGKVLGCQELYHVLQKKRFPDGTYDDTIGHCRRIYIANPNGSSVLALMRTAPASQVEGFRQLFTDYITPTPEPKFILRESDWWQGCFILSFNLPFFGTRHELDSRTISSHGGRLRQPYDLSFLDLNRRILGSPRDEDSASLPPPFLQETVLSLMVTGKSDRYWTAVFFDENPLDEEQTLELDEDLDPIILRTETKSMTTSPRSYALAALATALYRIIEHHADILYWLKTSFDLQSAEKRRISAIRQDPPAKTSFLSAMMSKVIGHSNKTTAARTSAEKWMDQFRDVLERVTDRNSSLFLKLDHFLSEDVMLDADALPRGLLWRSLQSDANSLKSLRRIKQYRHEFRDMEIEFRLLSKKVEERKDYQLDKGNAVFLQRYVMATLQLALTLLLLKPLFQLSLEALNPSTWFGLVIIVMLITTMVGCIFYLRRAP